MYMWVNLFKNTIGVILIWRHNMWDKNLFNFEDTDGDTQVVLGDQTAYFQDVIAMGVCYYVRLTHKVVMYS